MQITLISDMHGNCVALDAVLADLRRYPATPIVCLGDAIQGGPQPAQVVGRLRELACPVVMGNADAFLLSGLETGAEAPTAARKLMLDTVREWSLTQLSDEDKAFIAAFQPTVTIPLDDGRTLLCFHGSPTSACRSMPWQPPSVNGPPGRARYFAGNHNRRAACLNTTSPFFRRERSAH